MTEKGKSFLKFISLIFVFAVAAYISAPEPSRKKIEVKTKEKITIADGQQPVFGLIYVAQAKGYFADEGLEVTYRDFPSGKDALDDVLQGNSDLATVFNGPIVRASFDGEQLNIVSTLHSSYNTISLLANRTRGINNIEDTRGKTIAVQEGTTAEYILHSLLSANDINLEEVRILNLPNEDGAKSFVDGKVDGAVLWNVSLIRTKRMFSPDEVVEISSDFVNEFSVLAGKSEFVENNQNKIEMLLRGLLKARDFIGDNKEEAVEILSLKTESVSKDEMRQLWDMIEWRIALDNLLLTSLEREADWYVQQGVYDKKVPNFRKVIYTNYLDRVSPDHVTIY